PNDREGTLDREFLSTIGASHSRPLAARPRIAGGPILWGTGWAGTGRVRSICGQKLDQRSSGLTTALG
ncbi:MAG: hypothetical protein AAB459_03990, partial [Patescibacteria group bacterium]